MEDSLQSALRELADHVAEENRVRALWLFGSVARGESRPTSDVDLAVLTEEPLSWRERFRRRREAVRILGRDDVDLVDVNDASPVLLYQIVSNGRRLFARDPEAIDRFEQRAVMRYLDTRHLRETKYRLRKRGTS